MPRKSPGPWEKAVLSSPEGRWKRNVWKIYTCLLEFPFAFSKEVSTQCQELCTWWIQTNRGEKIVKSRKVGEMQVSVGLK